MSNFEKKFGRYAIKNITLYLIIAYAVGYVVELIAPSMVNYLSLNPYEIISHFQIWRLISWIIIPPSSFSIFTLIMLYFYYSLGTSLENVWGCYRYNIYLISGILFTIAGAFGLYLFEYICYGDQAYLLSYAMAMRFSTYYINMSIFLAFAATFPDVQVYFFFVIPVKVKYMGIIYAAILAYEFISFLSKGAIAACVVILVSILNFIVFFITQRKKISSFGNKSFAAFRKRSNSFGDTSKFKTDKNSSTGKITRHKCAICGKTDQSDPNISFRFCSKCNGNYEYCENHLFTHQHVE